MELRSRCWQRLELTTNLPTNLDRTMRGQGPRPGTITTCFARMRSEGFLLLSGDLVAGPCFTRLRPNVREHQYGVSVSDCRLECCWPMSCHVVPRHVT